MAFWLLLAGLGLALVGAVVSGVADAWLSRAVLLYLDAVEANVGQLAEAVRGGATNPTVTGVDLKRDLGQDRARVLKTLGWLILAAGFALQMTAVWMMRGWG